MSSMNRVFLMGHMTRDPQLRRLPSGMSVADFGIAVNEKYRNKSGEAVESTCFADVVAWGRQAETCEQYLKKGAALLVEGSLQLDQWENSAGERRSKLKVRANRVQFLNRPQGVNGAGTDSAEPEPAAPVAEESATPAAAAPAAAADGDNLPF